LLDSRNELATPGSRVIQEQVGETLGKSGVTVGQWELGVNEPSLMDFIGLAKLYGCDPAELAFGPLEERMALVRDYKPPVTQPAAADLARLEKGRKGAAKKRPKPGDDKSQSGHG
jgi:transcriptional regulator with XRE-family HTH domain